jgi:DNA invertase Pin-like site-specific DNA recombinase
MREADAAVRRTGFAVHLVSLVRGAQSSPPPTVVHPILEAAPVTVGRPGDGGRRRPIVRNTVEGVLNELDGRYGAGKELRKYNHILRYFEIDPEGDGALMARLSGNDISAGETVAVQLDIQHEMAERLGLRPRWVIVELQADRNVSYEQRMGFSLVRDLVAMHDLRWVSWREIDRIARDQMTSMAFCNWLRDQDLRLYLATDPTPLVDWTGPRLVHSLKRLLAEWEADKIVERTSNGLKRRFLETGRGWPGLIPFGFRRGPQDFLVVDEDQWDIVHRIYELYLSQHPDGRPFSMRNVLAHLKADGMDVTYYVVQRVLSDRVYVTGRLETTHKGIVYGVRPILLRRPIPEDVYARVQAQRYGRRGKNTVTPYGYFLLNHIPLVHSRCEGQMVSGGRARLSAYLFAHSNSTWETHRYAHKPKPDTCALCGVPAPPLERVVIEALYALAGDAEVREAWMANGRGDGQTTVQDLTQSEIANIEAKLHNRRHRHADLLRRFVDDDDAGGDALAQYSELARALEIDVRRLEQRLARAQRVVQASAEAPEADVLEQRLRTELPVNPPLDDPAALRRRVEIIRACVDKVVVHDDDDTGEIRVEVFGPLVPPTAPLVTFLPGDGLDTEELIGKTALADQFSPSWRTTLLPVPVRARPPATLASLAEDVRRVHAASPPGLMFRFHRGSRCAWSDRRQAFDLPSVVVMSRVCRREGWTPSELVRGVLTPREIVEGRRLGCVNAAEWFAAFCVAFESGFVPCSDRQREWRSRGLWPKLRTLEELAHDNGVRASEALTLAYSCWLGTSDSWHDTIRSRNPGRDRAVVNAGDDLLSHHGGG